MPSSTSSFDPGIISDKHVKAIILSFLAGFLLILAVENLLRFKGAETDVKDTPELWASQRARASSLGEQALILVGSSSIQLDLDLAIVAEATGLKPVQLAIDGSPYLEVLENLADDKSVIGTVLISTTLRKLFPGYNSLRVFKWIAVYEGKYKNLWSPKKEQSIKASLQAVSVLYANIIPLEHLIPLLFDGKKRLGKIYLRTLPDRERNADFTLVKMPDFYLRRVERNLGYPLPADRYTSYDEYRDAVIRITKDNYSQFSPGPHKLYRIKEAIRKLKQRGVLVIIAKFPLSGLVESISDIRYPKEHWDRVVAELGVSEIDYRDFPKLAYQLPDGSHLDMSQKSQFTIDFTEILLQQPGMNNDEK